MTGAIPPTTQGPVISNTTPLITLAELGLLDLLRALYGLLWIPQAVFDEYQAGIATHPLRPDSDRALARRTPRRCNGVARRVRA